MGRDMYQFQRFYRPTPSEALTSPAQTATKSHEWQHYSEVCLVAAFELKHLDR